MRGVLQHARARRLVRVLLEPHPGEDRLDVGGELAPLHVHGAVRHGLLVVLHEQVELRLVRVRVRVRDRARVMARVRIRVRVRAVALHRVVGLR